MPTLDTSKTRREIRTHSALRAWWLCKIKGYRLKHRMRSEPVATVFRRVRYKKTWVLGLPAIEPEEPQLENEAFKRCSACGFLWSTRASLLSDPDLRIIGYQARFEQLLAGIFLFNHSCGGTLAFEASVFQDLYDGLMFEEPLTGTDACPEYCLYADELRPCPAECECAYVREILQIVKNWPKDDRK